MAVRAQSEAEGPERGRRKARGRILNQARILTSRYLKVFLRDRRNVIILLGQIPILGLAVAALFKSGVFIRPPKDAGQAVELTFLLLVTTVWVGSLGSARGVIKGEGGFVPRDPGG